MLWSVVSIASTVIWFALLARLIVVYIRGSETVRRQVLWVALAALIAFVVSAPLTVFGFGDNTLLLVYTLIPVAILIAYSGTGSSTSRSCSRGHSHGRCSLRSWCSSTSVRSRC